MKAVLIALALCGCSASATYSTTYAMLATAERVDGIAVAQFPTLDRNKRLAIVSAATSKADGEKQLAAWDVTSDKLTKAIQGTDAAVKLARDAVAEIAAGKRDKAELAGWIASAVRLGIDLKGLLAASGINIGGAL